LHLEHSLLLEYYLLGLHFTVHSAAFFYRTRTVLVHLPLQILDLRQHFTTDPLQFSSGGLYSRTLATDFSLRAGADSLRFSSGGLYGRTLPAHFSIRLGADSLRFGSGGHYSRTLAAYLGLRLGASLLDRGGRDRSGSLHSGKRLLSPTLVRRLCPVRHTTQGGRLVALAQRGLVAHLFL
jgi:hypothetical protein